MGEWGLEAEQWIKTCAVDSKAEAQACRSWLFLLAFECAGIHSEGWDQILIHIHEHNEKNAQCDYMHA